MSVNERRRRAPSRARRRPPRWLIVTDRHGTSLVLPADEPLPSGRLYADPVAAVLALVSSPWRPGRSGQAAGSSVVGEAAAIPERMEWLRRLARWLRARGYGVPVQMGVDWVPAPEGCRIVGDLDPARRAKAHRQHAVRERAREIETAVREAERDLGLAEFADETAREGFRPGEIDIEIWADAHRDRVVHREQEASDAADRRLKRRDRR